MIRISFEGSSDQRILAAIRARGPKIIASLTTGMDLAMLELQRRVQKKLSGEVLQRRTGKLLGSIIKEPVRRDGNQIVGQVSGAAGPAFYGRIQEFGGKKAYVIRAVNARALRFQAGGKTVFAKSVQRQPLQARPFMSTSLEEMRDQIVARIRQGALKGLE